MIILRQRYYSLGSDLKYSGLGRTIKKYIGRARRRVGDKLDESIQKDIDIARKAADNIKFSSPIRSKEVEKKLISKAEKGKAVVIDYGGKNLTYPYEEIKDIPLKDVDSAFKGDVADKVKDAIKNKKDLIYHPKGSGVGSFAHEIGHTRTKNMILRKISKASKTMPGMINSIKINKDPDTERGLLNGAKRFIRSRSILAEEKLANKSGLRLLRKSGLSKNELDRVKEQYASGEVNYKHSSNAYYKSPILNSIQIPSRLK